MYIDTNIIKIGNSQGIRIPKAILEQCGLNGKVRMRVDEDGLFIKKSKKRKVREGWAESIKRDIEKHGVPENLWPDDMVNEFDKTEWTWPEEKH